MGERGNSNLKTFSERGRVLNRKKVGREGVGGGGQEGLGTRGGDRRGGVAGGVNEAGGEETVEQFTQRRSGRSVCLSVCLHATHSLARSNCHCTETPLGLFVISREAYV